MDNCNDKIYLDDDGDGYGDPNNEWQNSATCHNCVEDNTDCNDADEDEFPGQKWYKDADGDFYSDGTTQISCKKPNAEYEVASKLDKLSCDCDDNDADIQECTWYKDADDDGYSDGTIAPVSCERPPKYKIESELSSMDNDCDDTDKNEHPSQTWYKDADGDGYSDEKTEPAITCERPNGYKIQSEFTGLDDCDDTDKNEHPGQTWYKDTDNDGYSDEKTEPAITCERPSKYKIQSELTGLDDCNDEKPSVYPGATETCGDGVDQDCKNGDLLCPTTTTTTTSTTTTKAQLQALQPQLPHVLLGMRMEMRTDMVIEITLNKIVSSLMVMLKMTVTAKIPTP